MANTALLMMDLQRSMVGRVQDDGYLPRVQEAAAAARAAGLPVIHVVVGFRAGHPEIDRYNPTFGAAPEGFFTDADPDAAIHPDIAPLDGEPVVTKKRVSAFAGSDLDMILRAAGVRDLVLTGIATSGVVLSTLRQAADLDFRMTVLADACYDPDPEVHRVLTEKVFAKQATVTTVKEWAATLG